MEDTNYWYYTLSAIPQTLAAVVALAATFVVFKLSLVQQKTDKQLELARRLVSPLCPENEIDDIEKMTAEQVLVELNNGSLALQKQTDPRLIEFRYKELSELLTEIRDENHQKFPVTNARVDLFIKQRQAAVEQLVANRHRILKLLKLSIVFTLIPLTLSILILPSLPLLMAYATPIINALALGTVASVIYTAYCVWAIAKY